MESAGQYALDLDQPLHPHTAERRAERAALTDADPARRTAALLERHRQEWEAHLDLWWDAHHYRNLNLAKLAKLQADTLRLRQADERKAWGLEEENGVAPLSPEENWARIRELLRLLDLSV